MLRLAAVVLTLLTSAVLVFPQQQGAAHDDHKQQEKQNLTALEGIIDNTEHPHEIRPVTIYPWGSKDVSVHTDETKQDDVLYNAINTEFQSFMMKLTSEEKQDDSSTTEKGSPDMVPAASNSSEQMEITTKGELNSPLRLEDVSDIHQLASSLHGKTVKAAEKKHSNSSNQKKQLFVKQSTDRSVSQTGTTTDKKRDLSSHQHGDISTVVQSTSRSNAEVEQSTQGTLAVTSQKQEDHTDVAFVPTISSTSLSTLMEQITERTSAVTSGKQGHHTDVTFLPNISSTNLSTLMEQTTERTSAVTSGKQEDHTDVAFTPTISSTTLSTPMEQTTERTSAVTSGRQEDHTDVAFTPTTSSANLSTLMDQITERTSAVTSGKQEDHTDVAFIPTFSSTTLSTLMEQIAERTSVVTSGKQEDHTDVAFIPTFFSTTLSTLMEQFTEKTSAVTSGKQEDHTDVAFSPSFSSTNLSTLMEQTTEKTSAVTSGIQEDHTDVAFIPTSSSTTLSTLVEQTAERTSAVTSGKQEDHTDMTIILTIPSSNLSTLMEQTTERTSAVTSGIQEDHTDVAFIPTISSTNLSTLMEQITERTSAVTSAKQEDHTDVAFIPTFPSTNLSTLMEISTNGELNSSLKAEDVSDIPQPASSILGLRVQMMKMGEKKQDNSSHKQKDFPFKQSTDHSVSQTEITTDNIQDPSFHQHGDFSTVVLSTSSSNVEVEQTTQRTSAVTSQKQEDHTEVAFISTISSTNLSTLMEISTEGQLNNSLKLEDVSDVHQSGSRFHIHMVKIGERKQDNSSHEQKDFKVKQLTYPSVSKIVITTDKKQQDPSSHQYGDLSIIFQSINGSNLEVEKTSQRILPVTSEKQEDQADETFSSTISSINLSTLVEVGVEKNQNESPLKLEVLPYIYQSTTSPTVRVKQTAGRNLAITSPKQEYHTDVAKNPNITTQVIVRAEKRQNKSSQIREVFPFTHLPASRSFVHVDQTTERNPAVTSEKQEDDTDATNTRNLSSDNLNEQMELETEEDEGDSYSSLEDSSELPNSRTSSGNNANVQMDPTNDDTQSNSAHRLEVSSGKANSLKISSSDLNAQVEQGVEKEHKTNSRDVHHSASNSDAEMEMSATWDLNDIPYKLKDIFVLISNMNASASNIHEQVYLPTTVSQDKSPKREVLSDELVPKKLNTSASNLETQVELGVEYEQDSSSYTEEVLPDEPENTNVSVTTPSTQTELSAEKEWEIFPHGQEDLSEKVNMINNSASNLSAQIELSTEKEQEIFSRKQEDLLDKVEVAVQNKQDSSSQKQVDQSASSSSDQMEVEGAEEQDNPSHEQGDASNVPYNLNISASNLQLQVGNEDEEQDYFVMPHNLSYSASNMNTEYPILPITVAPEESLFDTEASTFNAHQFQILHYKNQLSKHLTTELDAFKKKRSQDFQMEPLKQDKSYQKGNYDNAPINMDLSASNVDVQMMEPADEEKDNSQQQENFYDMPYDLDQSASNMNEQLEPLAEEKEVEDINEYAFEVGPSSRNRNFRTRSRIQKNKDVTPAPLVQHQSASNIKHQIQGEFREGKDLNIEPFGLDQSTSNANIRTQAKIQGHKDINEASYGQHQSASNVNYGIPAKFQEGKDLIHDYYGVEESTNNINLGIPQESRKYKNRYDEPYGTGHSVSDINMELSAEDYDDTDFTENPIDVELATSEYMEMLAGGRPYGAFNAQPIAKKHYTTNARMETPEEEEEYGVFNEQPFSMRHSTSNVRVEQTTEVKRGRFHKAEGFYDFGRYGKKSYVPVERTTEVKRERFHKAEGFYDFGRSAKKMESPAAVKGSNSVKPKGFNKNPFNFEYSASNVNMDKLRNFDQENSLKEEDFYYVPDEKDQLTDTLKVQYLVKSFNETNQNGAPAGSGKGSEMHTPQEQANIIKEFQEPNMTCPAEFAVLADPNGDCSVYYMCHNWTMERRVCSRDLHFNPISKVCDYPGKAVCDLKCIEDNDRYHVPGYCNMYLDCNNGEGRYVKCSDGLHYNAVTKQCDSPAKAACEITCMHYNTLVALPGRCNMYGNCEEGVITYYLCPPGLHFNPVTLKCDIPETEQCRIECLSADGYFPVLGQCMNYIECRNNHGKVISCPSGLHFNFLLQTCDIPSKAGCEMRCKEPNGFFPFPGVCSYFIMCINGTPFMKKCPADLEFNEDTNQCDIVSKNHCMPYCPMENGIFPVDNHCDLYVRCSHGQPLVKRCPRGLHFNALFKHCDLPEHAKCEFPCPYSSGIFPLPGKCNKYMRCENDVATTFTCAEGLHFNARTQTCDWPPAAQCELSCPEWDGYFAVQGACNAYVVCNEGRPILKKCPHGKHFNLEAKHCDYPDFANCEFICPESDGLFPYRGHCDSYIHCEDGKPHVDSCPPGLLFNLQTTVCDLAENVRCYE